eukprot:11277912-Alexandrium_andersonii.AAC.1
MPAFLSMRAHREHTGIAEDTLTVGVDHEPTPLTASHSHCSAGFAQGGGEHGRPGRSRRGFGSAEGIVRDIPFDCSCRAARSWALHAFCL